MKIKGMTALAAAALMCATSAHAENLVNWNFSGTISSISKTYERTPSWLSSFTDEEKAAADQALAPFAAGQQFSIRLTVDLDTFYGPDGVASFPNAIKQYEFSVPTAGISGSNSKQVHQGISITPDDPAGDVIYFYLPPTYDAEGTGKLTFGGALYFTDPAGTLNQAPDLHALASSFDLTRYTFKAGGVSVDNGLCGAASGCGDLGLSITGASVSAVPEPGAFALLVGGLALLPALRTRRR